MDIPTPGGLLFYLPPWPRPHRWKAFRLFLIMHYSKPHGGALSDIYLEKEREGLVFK